MKYGIRAAALFLFSIFLFPKPGLAYLDPGSGSYIFQIILAALLAASCAVKVFWERIKIFFMRMFSRKKDNGPKS